MVWHHALKGEQQVSMYSLNASQHAFKYFDNPVVISRYRRHRCREHPPFLSGICRLTNALRIKTINKFLEGTKFVTSSIDDNAALTNFLGSVPGAFGRVRGLFFDYFSRMPSTAVRNQDLERAASCTGLRELKIMMQRINMGHRTG